MSRRWLSLAGKLPIVAHFVLKNHFCVCNKKGLGNPHGEESELLYYVDKDLLKDIKLKINPDLEILW